jgi:hypothetical protein
VLQTEVVAYEVNRCAKHHVVSKQALTTALHTFSRQHDSKLEALAHRVVACGDKIEYFCTELAALKQEDARATDETLSARGPPHHARRGHTSQAKSRSSRKGRLSYNRCTGALVSRS